MLRAAKRDLASFRAVKANNFFLFVALLVYGAGESGMEPSAAEPFLLVLAFLMLFPLSADPLRKIPPTRLALWPLGAGDRAALRLATLLLSPVLWFAAAALLVKTRRPALGMLFLLLVLAAQVLAGAGRRIAARAPRASRFRFVPALPGRLGQLVRANLRQMLSVLNVYIALLLSAGGALWRLVGRHPDPMAFPILALLVGLALSTYAQCLFGLDAASSALTRYRLLPLAGWQILLAKDAAFLAILLLLVLPLAPGPGLTFGLTALAIGHWPSLSAPAPQHRWRFTGHRLFPAVVQALAALILACAEYQRGPQFLALAAALYTGSLVLGGRYWEHAR